MRRRQRRRPAPPRRHRVSPPSRRTPRARGRRSPAHSRGGGGGRGGRGEGRWLQCGHPGPKARSIRARKLVAVKIDNGRDKSTIDVVVTARDRAGPRQAKRPAAGGGADACRTRGCFATCALSAAVRVGGIFNRRTGVHLGPALTDGSTRQARRSRGTRSAPRAGQIARRWPALDARDEHRENPSHVAFS